MSRRGKYTGNQVEIGGEVYTHHQDYKLKSMATKAARKLIKQGYEIKVLVSDAADLGTSIFHPSYLFSLKRYEVLKRKRR